jgi:hypothetical protein
VTETTRDHPAPTLRIAVPPPVCVSCLIPLNPEPGGTAGVAYRPCPQHPNAPIFYQTVFATPERGAGTPMLSIVDLRRLRELAEREECLADEAYVNEDDPCSLGRSEEHAKTAALLNRLASRSSAPSEGPTPALPVPAQEAEAAGNRWTSEALQQRDAETLAGDLDHVADLFADFPTRANVIREAARRLRSPSEIPEAPPFLAEEYWCGCTRRAQWDRCDAHQDFEHDEEPPIQRSSRSDTETKAVARCAYCEMPGSGNAPVVDGKHIWPDGHREPCGPLAAPTVPETSNG